MDYNGKKHLLISDIDVMADRSVSCRNPTSRDHVLRFAFIHSAIGIIIEEHDVFPSSARRPPATETRGVGNVKASAFFYSAAALQLFFECVRSEAC